MPDFPSPNFFFAMIHTYKPHGVVPGIGVFHIVCYGLNKRSVLFGYDLISHALNLLYIVTENFCMTHRVFIALI